MTPTKFINEFIFLFISEQHGGSRSRRQRLDRRVLDGFNVYLLSWIHLRLQQRGKGVAGQRRQSA
jgi:hypothetical protein